MNFKRILMTGLLLLLLCPCTALAEEEPIIYTVKEGDTLWDISQRYIKDPYYWPNLWSNNPDVGNPHLIYPGQKLRIYDGRIEIIPVTEGETPEGEEIAEVTPEAVQMIPTFGGARSFMGDEEIDSLGTLVDAVDNRVLIGEQDKVFIEMKDLSGTSPGDEYELIALREPIKHPATNKKIGYRVAQLGKVLIVEVTDSVAVGLITDALVEIERGALLRPLVVIPSKVPRKVAEQELMGYIVSADEGKVALGQWDVIHIDIGEDAGLEVGHELDLFRNREASEFAVKRKGLQLPDIDLGDAIVLEVRQGYSEALITRIGKLPLYRGDQVVTKTE